MTIASVDRLERGWQGRLEWRWRALACALAAAALLAGGCGGDGEETDVSEEVRQEYVTGVQDALAPITRQSQALVAEAAQARSIEALARPLDETEAAYTTAAEQLEALEPPEEVVEQHEQLIDAHRDVAAAAAEAEQAAQRGDREGLDQFRAAGAEYSERAEELGAQFSQEGIDF